MFKEEVFPKKYSAVLDQAILDIQKCRRSPYYEISMDNWHRRGNRACKVGLAGALMAQTGKLNRGFTMSPAGFVIEDEFKLRFLSAVTRGNAGLQYLPVMKSEKCLKSLYFLSVNPIVSYPSLIQFKALRTIARELRKLGF